MKFLTQRSAQGMIEWLIVAILIVVLLGAVLVTLFSTLSTKFQGINNAL